MWLLFGIVCISYTLELTAIPLAPVLEPLQFMVIIYIKKHKQYFADGKVAFGSDKEFTIPDRYEPR
jgi:hypothetical protein